ncbi:MAG: OmpA family protein, partial [Deltaproteobacteria bacterium]|nr:OmpA family protein [Deltaproteobacteria bacterium]
WVEQGPQAVLAAAIRGSAPVELRQALREALEAIHMDMQDEFEAFEGDSAPFERARYHLEDCLQTQTIRPDEKTSPVLWILLAILLGLGGWWIWSGWSEGRRLDRLLNALHREPGIVVTETVTRDGTVLVHGLRDPLAADPDELASQFNMEEGDVRFQLEPYFAVHGPFILQRAERVLRPPPEVELDYDEGRFTASGEADGEWIRRAREMVPLLPGVTSFWDRLRERGEIDPMIELTHRVESHVVRFEVDSAEISDEEAASVERAAGDILALVRHTGGGSARVLVEGHADPTGAADRNVELSQRRAQAVITFLVEHGVPASAVRPVGRGAADTEPAADDEDMGSLRKVTFTVEIGTGDTQQESP